MGLTQEALGKIVGVTAKAIQDYEAGRGSPTLARLDLLAKAFGVSVAQLLESKAPEMAPVIRISDAVRVIDSIPDDIYQMAAKFNKSHPLWETVRGILDDEIEALSENESEEQA